MSEFPRELIRQVQISTRSAAGLSGYDPSDPTLPALPSLSAAIAAFEPSPPHLRCAHCKGRLLRGLQSNICVYCGVRCQHDVAPDPLCFNSTIGYQWLLSSLNLDGSEIVKPPTNKNEQDQGRSSPKTEIPLSDFLNFKIAWSYETEKQDTIVNDKLSEEKKITRVAPDNFFFKSIRDDIKVGTTGTKEVAALGNQNLPSVQSMEAAGWPSTDKSTEAFSEWEADFQSAVSENQHGVSTSSDHSISLSADSGKQFQDSQSSHITSMDVDLSAHMDSVFGHKKDPADENQIDHPVASPASDWNSDDLWTNVSSNESQLAGGFDSAVNVKDDHPSENLNNLSTSSDLFQNFQWQTNDTDTLENKTTNGVHITITESQDVGGFVGNASVDDHTVEISNNVPSSVDLFQDFQWQTDKDIAGNKAVNEEQISMNQPQLVEGFFPTVCAEGSTSLQDPFQTDWIQSGYLSTSHKKSSNVDFFSPNSKFEDRDVGSFSQPMVVSASADIKKSTTEINDISPETPSKRLSDTSSPSYESGEAANNANDFGTSSKPQDDIKMLISQMHDLSFMLKSDLCIPSGSDSPKSSTQD